MKFGFILLLASALTGCTAFKDNLEASREAGSIQSLNEKQASGVSEFADGGQLNSDEEEAMNDSISGSSEP